MLQINYISALHALVADTYFLTEYRTQAAIILGVSLQELMFDSANKHTGNDNMATDKL